MGPNLRGGRRRKSRGGFTFVEVLAALIFLAVVVPAIVTALTLSNKASEVTERSAAAGELAENKLNEMLTADAWQNGSTMAGGLRRGLAGVPLGNDAESVDRRERLQRGHRSRRRERQQWHWQRPQHRRHGQRDDPQQRR